MTIVQKLKKGGIGEEIKRYGPNTRIKLQGGITIMKTYRKKGSYIHICKMTAPKCEYWEKRWQPIFKWLMEQPIGTYSKETYKDFSEKEIMDFLRTENLCD